MTSLMTESDEQCRARPLSADDVVWRSDDDDDDDDARLQPDWDDTAASLWHHVIWPSLVCTSTAADDANDDSEAIRRSRLEMSMWLLSIATSCCCWNTNTSCIQQTVKLRWNVDGVSKNPISVRKHSEIWESCTQCVPARAECRLFTDWSLDHSGWVSKTSFLAPDERIQLLLNQPATFCLRRPTYMFRLERETVLN